MTASAAKLRLYHIIAADRKRAARGQMGDTLADCMSVAIFAPHRMEDAERFAMMLPAKGLPKPRGRLAAKAVALRFKAARLAEAARCAALARVMSLLSRAEWACQLAYGWAEAKRYGLRWRREDWE